VPAWAKCAVDEWTAAAGINGRPIFRRVSRLDKVWGDGIIPKAIWHVVKAAAERANIKNLAPHDLRRTCARLCHLAGRELEQIQFLLGHAWDSGRIEVKFWVLGTEKLAYPNHLIKVPPCLCDARNSNICSSYNSHAPARTIDSLRTPTFEINAIKILSNIRSAILQARFARRF